MTMSAMAATEAVRTGALRVSDLARASVAAIERDDRVIQAMASFDPDRALQDAERVEATCADGPLAGVTIGVKDIFDTWDHPTEFYSPIYRGRRPASDAWLVDRLRRAGAVIMGKTHTAELAYTHTGPTHNPHDLRRTPGSSSAGSAAGVAAGLFSVAIGTQTAGSTLKPAAYCGVFAMKPSFGSVPLAGVKAFAPSFDTAGWFARDIRDLRLVAQAVMPGLSPARAVGRPLRLAFCRTRWALDEDVAAALAEAIRHLRSAGMDIDEISLPPDFEARAADHAILNDVEATRSLAYEAALGAPLVSEELKSMFDRTARYGAGDEAAARTRLADAKAVTLRVLERYDALIQPSCGCVAPLGLGSTGPSDFIKVWSGMGLPQINIPLLTTHTAAPAGVQLIGAPAKDAALLEVAAAVARILIGPHPVRPVLDGAPLSS